MLTKPIINNEIILKMRWLRKDTDESSHGKSIRNNIVKNMTTNILQNNSRQYRSTRR